MDELAQNSSLEKRRVPPLLWWAGVLLLLAWHAWLTLGLFGSGYPWPHLTDDEPILSGAHPQHLHLSSVGASALRNTGQPCAYDPAFQAAYLKTPIFNGSRLAEFFVFAGGPSHRTAAYKIAIVVICMLAPLLLLVAARGLGVDRGPAWLAAAIGVLIFWGPHSRGDLEAGEPELLLGSLAILAHLGMLVQYDRHAGLLPWLGMVLTAALGWFAQPLLLPIALPLLLLYYLCVGVRHANLAWHVALATAEVGALAINLPWLFDWVSYWWLRLPLPDASELLPHRTFSTLWTAPLWGGPAERLLAVALLTSALFGIAVMFYSKRRPAARLLFLGVLGLLALAFLGIAWEPLGRLGTAALFAPALWFAAIPAAFGWFWLAQRLFQHSAGKVAIAVVGLGVALGIWLNRDFLSPVYSRAVATEPFQIGLGVERKAIVAQLIETTTTEARILWEDRPLPRIAPRWSALLPALTGRYYLGGLDPDGFIEHSSISFLNQLLDGRHISAWTDQELEDYCRRYNVGWVVCWSPATIKRFSEWEAVQSSQPLVDDVAGYLFTLKRPAPSFALKGQAKLIHADTQHITLADVVPDADGVVVLSLHWQAGLRAAPSRIGIEREPCGNDPIGFIRLRLESPAARVTLTWSDR